MAKRFRALKFQQMIEKATRQRGFRFVHMTNWPWPLLAGGADAEEFQLVSDGTKTVPCGDSLLQIVHRTLVQFDNPSAAGAHKMMMVSIVPLVEQFESRDSVAKVEFLYHARLLQ